jgi:hypothetical protein
VPFMLRHAQHERKIGNDCSPRLVRPEPVEGRKRVLLPISKRRPIACDLQAFSDESRFGVGQILAVTGSMVL